MCGKNPNGIPYHSPGLRYAATLGGSTHTPIFYPEGVTSRLGRNPVGVEGRLAVLSQGSGVPQPWAVVCIPFREFIGNAKHPWHSSRHTTYCMWLMTREKNRTIYMQYNSYHDQRRRGILASLS